MLLGAGQVADHVSGVLSWQTMVQKSEFFTDLSLLVRDMNELVKVSIGEKKLCVCMCLVSVVSSAI